LVLILTEYTLVSAGSSWERVKMDPHEDKLEQQDANAHAVEPTFGLGQEEVQETMSNKRTYELLAAEDGSAPQASIMLYKPREAETPNIQESHPDSVAQTIGHSP
jgi:hypothetical protein